MGSSDTKPPKVAYMYEADEEGRPIQGTKQSARTDKKGVSTRSDKRKSKSDSGKYEAMMSGAIQGDVIPDKEVKLERRRSSASTKSPSKSRDKPPSAHTNRVIPLRLATKDNPSNYGIPTRASPVVQQPQPIPLRPRAVTSNTYPSRPVSYHAAYTGAGYATGPPLSASAYYQQPPPITPSYPPPSPSSSFMRYAATPQQDYFITPNTGSIRPLSQRFGQMDPIQRTSSAYGIHDLPVQQQIQDAYEDGYASASEGRRNSIRIPSRRNSLSRKVETTYDQSMPPPPLRPGILRNRTTEYQPDPAAPEPTYRDSRSTYREPPTRRAPSSHRNSVSYDLPEARVETANTSHRRQSYYGQSATPAEANGWEAKAAEAQNYQEDVSGPSIPLTAEALRRRHAGSSRSTKSSGSRDESDYRKSATTRTTRSGSGQEDGEFTIKVKGGQARVMVGGAQIDCTEGGEIEIKRQKSIRNGSERSSSEYGTRRIDDRRSRVERPSGRSRKSSVHSGQSYTRSTPQYPTEQWV
jgi:hypothetical protein